MTYRYGDYTPTQHGWKHVLLLKCFLHYPVQDGQANMHTSSEPSAEVRGAGENVAKAIIPHELPASLLN